MVLSEKEIRIYNAIKNYIEKEKISPTVRDICLVVNLSSSATVHKYITNLENKKYISRIKDCPRSIRIIQDL